MSSTAKSLKRAEQALLLRQQGLTLSAVGEALGNVHPWRAGEGVCRERARVLIKKARRAQAAQAVLIGGYEESLSRLDLPEDHPARRALALARAESEAGRVAAAGLTLKAIGPACRQAGIERWRDAVPEVAVADLDLDIQVVHFLQGAGITTLGALSVLTRESLLAIRRIGPGALKQIEDDLASRGLALAPPPPRPVPTDDDWPAYRRTDLSRNFDLSERPLKALIAAGIDTLAALCAHSAESLRALPRIGPWSIVEIKEELAKRGLALAEGGRR